MDRIMSILTDDFIHGAVMGLCGSAPVCVMGVIIMLFHYWGEKSKYRQKLEFIDKIDKPQSGVKIDKN